MSDVLFERRGKAGVITLSRPDALNALTRDMCLALSAQLEWWANDGAVSLVIIQGVGNRAFSAGGDIRALYESGKAGTSYARDFYAEEYRLNTRIKEFPKPYVALIDGIVMGGGVGVSVHGSYRIAGDRTLFAMPETGIGLFPDVGGTYFLPRLPGETGLYLGLTGARLEAADAVYLGVATQYVPTVSRDKLVATLAQTGDVEAVCADFSKPAGEPPLAAHRATLDRLFGATSLEQLIAGLEREDDAWSAETLKTLRQKSPTALKITFRQLRQGARLSFRDAMKLEYRLSCRVMQGHDFYEGVRAAVIDKDQAPHWHPARLEDVSEAAIDAYFTPLGADELQI